ncbi:hypothetical protein J4E86_010425 [Alternaria arbusti]|uniref:uncharacterized protein n=1 Tax=Alternaria arbusti TaxID=232088 RepID=UPI002220DC15|nr:uncharacterized protein J4E86_010425 [Alternaria arbusti]KAI4941393.1 hypothetical protein J4E86_010425 [Alternaria arbusti]
MDFSQYGGPSDEWLAVEKTLPARTFDISLDPIVLRNAVNSEREARSAEVKQLFAPHVQTKDHAIPTRDGSTIEARTYRSAKRDASEKLPVYLYFHGGGFIFGSLSSEDPLCAQTAIKTGALVLNVNYRHTPEHIFPTAWNDTHDAFVWLHKNIDMLGGDPSQVVVGGISAGGNLAASLTLEQHLGKSEDIAGLPTIAGQILIIPMLAHPATYDQGPGKLLNPSTSSYVENEDAPVLPKKTIDFFTKLLKIGDVDLKDTKMNVVNATEEEVKGFPPTVFGIAGLDPLRDEALLFSKKLSEANVPTSTTLFKGVPHGHRRFGKALKASEHWDQCVDDGILWVLSKPKATGKFDISFSEFVGSNVPPYAILSHRWREQEVLYDDMAATNRSVARSKKGYAKLEMTCRLALEHGLSYVWSDTCCIDKSSSAELSEAINSMYSYYTHSKWCIAYLDDVELGEDQILSRSAWFSRGWTLQELIAPLKLTFYAKSWKKIGTKADSCHQVSIASNIAVEVLRDREAISAMGVSEKMSWAASRVTTRPEDEAYSLMGIFGVNMATLYGEGRSSAFRRLQLEILRTSTDHSLFAWESETVNGDMLAPNPMPNYDMTNAGLRIQLPLRRENHLPRQPFEVAYPLMYPDW